MKLIKENMPKFFKFKLNRVLSRQEKRPVFTVHGDITNNNVLDIAKVYIIMV